MCPRRALHKRFIHKPLKEAKPFCCRIGSSARSPSVYPRALPAAVPRVARAAAALAQPSPCAVLLPGFSGHSAPAFGVLAGPALPAARPPAHPAGASRAAPQWHRAAPGAAAPAGRGELPSPLCSAFNAPCRSPLELRSAPVPSWLCPGVTATGMDPTSLVLLINN